MPAGGLAGVLALFVNLGKFLRLFARRQHAFYQRPGKPVGTLAHATVLDSAAVR